MNYDFEKSLKELGLDINESQKKQFEIYFELLVEWNTKMNLTAITDREGVFKKHFFDSLNLVRVHEFKNETLLDVGSGAGFPSIPLKIMFPDIKVTIIDALQKRITFLTELTKELEVDVELVHGRAEEYKRKHCFDVVTARAVAHLNMLSELCIPFVKVGGEFIAMKGPKLQEELKSSANAIKILGGQVKDQISYSVEEDQRSIIVISKQHKTQAKYPRRFNKIKSNPL